MLLLFFVPLGFVGLVVVYFGCRGSKMKVDLELDGHGCYKFDCVDCGSCRVKDSFGCADCPFGFAGKRILEAFDF